eukprot:COSAG02_NODE_188_length_30307_cov_341.858746_18_plen_123_part_00
MSQGAGTVVVQLDSQSATKVTDEHYRLASVAGESWVLAPLYHIERPVHVSAVAWRAVAGGGGRRRAARVRRGRARARARRCAARATWARECTRAAVRARVHARGGARAVHGRVPFPTLETIR